MTSPAYFCEFQVQQTYNPLRLNQEQTELDSFCTVLSLEKREALEALESLKRFLNLNESLSFDRLSGGNCNAPIAISKYINQAQVPIIVLKHEPDCVWSENRMKALDQMRQSGLDQLPFIYKDSQENYLVKLHETYYSVIQYLQPDSDQSSTIEEMFTLCANFHGFSTSSPFKELLSSCVLDSYSDQRLSHLDLGLVKWNPTIFETEAWHCVVKAAHYFTTESFRSIYNSLPTELLHGDIHPDNTIITQRKSFFVDFDKVRTDVRLHEFGIFLGWSFSERYLALTEEDKLFSCIEACYGKLEELEKEHLHEFVLFNRCCVIDWSLSEIKNALIDKDMDKEKEFERILKGTIREINQMYARIPKISNILL